MVKKKFEKLLKENKLFEEFVHHPDYFKWLETREKVWENKKGQRVTYHQFFNALKAVTPQIGIMSEGNWVASGKPTPNEFFNYTRGISYEDVLKGKDSIWEIPAIKLDKDGNPVEKKRRGRPTGVKNAPKTEEKRKRGRPRKTS